jgi:hypothetical protein
MPHTAPCPLRSRRYRIECPDAPPPSRPGLHHEWRHPGRLPTERSPERHDGAPTPGDARRRKRPAAEAAARLMSLKRRPLADPYSPRWVARLQGYWQHPTQKGTCRVELDRGAVLRVTSGGSWRILSCAQDRLSLKRRLISPLLFPTPSVARGRDLLCLGIGRSLRRRPFGARASGGGGDGGTSHYRARR